MDKPLEIIWRGPMDMSGYGCAGRGYVEALDKAGVKIRLVDKAMSGALVGKGVSDDIYALIDRLRTTQVDWRAPVVQHAVADKIRKRAASKLNIGYTIFELTSIPEVWIAPCNNMDIVFTGSKYSKQAFVRGGVKEDKLKILPHVIDNERFQPNLAKLKVQNLSGFNFLSVFDFQTRKGYKEILRAYWTAFNWTDDVALCLKCYRGTFNKDDQVKVCEIIASYKKELGFTKTPKVLFYGFDLPDNLMPNLYNTFDCFVMMGREGFGLPGAEAMACGLPVICPEVGGHREYTNADCSYLVRYLRDEPIDEDMEKFNLSFKGLSWSIHDWEHLSALMKQAFENRDEVKEKGKKSREHIEQKFNWKVISDIFINEVKSRL